MRKTILIASAIISVMASVNSAAETLTYVFLADQSTVVQTGGFAGIHETHIIEGHFQLTVDSGAGSAFFDWVDATLSESPFMYTRSLGMLFNMTRLTGTVVSNTKIEFEGKTADGTHADVQLAVTLAGDSVHLTGQITSPCCDFFDYQLDAIAQRVPVGWTYDYFDDFRTDKAETDSYIHSVFWPGEAFPPPEPYLHYYGTGANRGLVFMGYLGQPAHLGYCFPIGPAQGLRAVRGTLELDVDFPSNADISQSPPGYFLYSISTDGLNWSIPKPLGPGHCHIQIESVQGTCYVVFLGTRVMIDNLEVHLYSPPATIHVPEDFGTIQQAIDVAADGDIIEVAPGIYKGNGNWDIEFRGKAITVRSANGPEETVIDCTRLPGAANGGKGHRGFYFHEAERSDSVLCGFTIRGGSIPGSEIPTDDMRWNLTPTHPIGGGIYCEYSSPTIINCVIRECGTEVGGGIGCVGGSPAIIDCLIEDCTAGGFGNSKSGGRGAGIGVIRFASVKISNCKINNNSGYYNSYGGGVYCRRSSAVISDCDISFNSADGNIEGGGVYCADPQTSVVLRNCIISHNTAYVGGGIFTQRGANTAGCSDIDCPVCKIRVTNCTIAHNKLSEPQMPPFPGGGIHSVGSDIIVKNSIVWYNEGTPVLLIDPASNSPVVYSDVERGYLGQGNINADPLFAPTGVPDYHLQSIYGRYNPASGTWVIDKNHSPCIDAGDPKDPVGHEPLPNGRRINMGAYGGTRQASKGVARLVYHVDGINGNNSNSGLSRASAFATIQKGVNSARDGDIVMVWPAVYREEISFNGKAITVQSAADAAAVVASSGYAFSFYKGEGADSVLRNFVITRSEYAVFCDGASPTITNLTIADNQFGVAAYGGANPKITNCILWNNASGDLFQCEARYSCIQDEGHAEAEGNISTDPLFADPGNSDYHLQSRYGRYWPQHDVWVIDNATSPCIDAADPNVYPRRERMPNGGRLNMGAYGGTAFASMSQWPLKGDVNQDGVVNVKDFALVAESWLESLPWLPREVPVADVVSPVDGIVIPISVATYEY